MFPPRLRVARESFRWTPDGVGIGDTLGGAGATRIPRGEDTMMPAERTTGEDQRILRALGPILAGAVLVLLPPPQGSPRARGATSPWLRR